VSSLLIRNAVLRASGRRLDADGVLVEDGLISAVGSGRELAGRARPGTSTVDADGGLLTPAFADAHVHLGLAAMGGVQCRLDDADSVEACLALVAAFASGSAAPWITGGGWAVGLFPASGPTAVQLDRVTDDRPALLLDSDRHGAWANSAALRAAGIDRRTPDPADGRIERDAAGTPTGMLHEGAVQLVARLIPPLDAAALAEGIVAASRQLHAVGITAWQEAALGEYGGVPDFTAAYRSALAGGRLRGNPSGAIWVPRGLEAAGIDDFVAHCVALRAANLAAGFRTVTAKLMLDGIIESRTASMHEPYLGEDGGLGLAYFAPGLVQRLVPALNAAGFAVHVHAIGDRAVTDGLDGFARVPPAVRARVRNHIAHLELIREADVPRFAELGVTANLQPVWARADAAMRELTFPLLGEARIGRLFVFGSLQRSGAELAMGSDWPVSSLDPWPGLHVAVNRTPVDEPDRDPLGASEALPLGIALDAYTRGSHELLGEVNRGVLAVGAVADLAIADRDPFAAPASEIHLTRNRFTVLGGELVAGVAE
jgi:predicted amidohydrolase YtcJ